jgi:hypothetical protein
VRRRVEGKNFHHQIRSTLDIILRDHRRALFGDVENIRLDDVVKRKDNIKRRDENPSLSLPFLQIRLEATGNAK